MTEVSLTVPPSNVDPSLWSKGIPGHAEIGDIWLLSWDGKFLGLGTIAGFERDFVYMWPTTVSERESFYPAVKTVHHPLGVPSWIWPTRETSVGRHLLHKRMGHALSSRAMLKVAEAIDNDQTPLLERARKRTQSDTEIDEAMTVQWQDICLNEWPSPTRDPAPFDGGYLVNHDITVETLRELLDISLLESGDLMSRKALPSFDQVQIVSEHLNVPPTEVLSKEPDPLQLDLIWPDWKQQITEVMERHQWQEARTRNEVYAKGLTLVARSDRKVKTVLEQAIADLLQ